MDSAAFDVLLHDPFPLASEIDGIKYSVIRKVLEEKKITGNPSDNIAYVLEQKAVSLYT
jgi:hypothetical protein